MNQVALVGNITDDPELRYTQSGASLAGFTVAVSHGSKHNGEWQDVTDGFLRCTAWRSVAENASGTLKKGMRVFVPGKLVQRTWQDDSGNKTSPLERVPKASTSLPYGTVMSMTTVLLQGATMPRKEDLPDPLKPLALRHALELDPVELAEL
jgi:single-strand DNA-binding protein